VNVLFGSGGDTIDKFVKDHIHQIAIELCNGAVVLVPAHTTFSTSFIRGILVLSQALFCRRSTQSLGSDSLVNAPLLREYIKVAEFV